MCLVAIPDRLASASVVFFGQHGDISRHAQERDVSRQRLYREADSVVRDLDDSTHQQQLVHLQEQIVGLQAHLELLVASQTGALVVSTDLQAEFASTAQAEGVS